MVLTGAPPLGGQLLSINKIDGYPGFPDGVPGYDLCPIAQEQATAAGAVLKTRCNYSERRLRSITLIPTHSSRAWVSHTSV
jgi:thioredoxin reductase